MGETGLSTLTDTISHLDPAIVYLTIGDEMIETTPKHPFYTLDRGWVNAEDLRFGDRVPQLDGEIDAVRNVELVQRSQAMYNLTVAVAHTFFVGDQQWLVHNAKCQILPHERVNYNRGRADLAVYGIRYRGEYPLDGQPPNTILYRQNDKGDILSYAIYDDEGMIVKRIDLDPNSAPHRGVPPHVHDHVINITPDGRKFPKEVKDARPLEPHE